MSIPFTVSTWLLFIMYSCQSLLYLLYFTILCCKIYVCALCICLAPMTYVCLLVVASFLWASALTRRCVHAWNLSRRRIILLASQGNLRAYRGWAVCQPTSFIHNSTVIFFVGVCNYHSFAASYKSLLLQTAPNFAKRIFSSKLRKNNTSFSEQPSRTSYKLNYISLII